MFFNKTTSATLLIAGTTIGAGMLGIPLVSAKAGFIPAAAITLVAWLFMFVTGLLYLEVTLWMRKGSNVLSMANRFLGRRGKILAGAVYLFLYYCLMVAYFAVGAPILIPILGLKISNLGYFLYGVIFAGLVAIGLRVIDKLNYVLCLAMFLCYLWLFRVGFSEVSSENLLTIDSSQVFWAAPVLFSAFGYHNIIPSLTYHFERDYRLMRRSIFFGTSIACIVYLAWQWFIIGIVPLSAIEEALAQGKASTAALQMLNAPWIMRAGELFALFAVITSMLGVAFSLVDFLGDGLKVNAQKPWVRCALSTLVFLPPFLFTAIDPKIFMLAIGFAGGFGEAFLNGLLPVSMVWVGKYREKLSLNVPFFGRRAFLFLLFALGLSVMILEGFVLG